MAALYAARVARLCLTAELRNLGLLAEKCEGHDTRDVHLRTVHVHVEAELDADGLDVLETLLVVGTGTADPDLDLVLVEQRSDLAQSADDTLEGRGDLREIRSSGETGQGALTLVKLAIPPPMKRTLPSGRRGARSMRSRTVRA